MEEASCFALVQQCGEVLCELGDDHCGRVGARDHDGLLVERGEDVLDQPLGHPRGLRPQQRDQSAPAGLADRLGRAELFQQREDGRVLDARTEYAFEVRVDLGEQAAQSVRDPGDLAGEVVIEAHDHVEFGDGLVVQLDRAERVRHGAGGVRDDRRVPRVGLALTRVEVRDPPHRQARKVGDLAARIAGHGQRQSADRGRLVDHQQHTAVLRRELVEHGPHLRLAVRQRLVDHALAVRRKAGGVVFALADVQAEEHGHVAGVEHFVPPIRVCLPGQGTAPTSGNHVTKSVARSSGAPAPISDLPAPPDPVTPPPGSWSTGGKSHAGPEGREPQDRGRLEGNGVRPRAGGCRT